jgi:hypothetical protein
MKKIIVFVVLFSLSNLLLSGCAPAVTTAAAPPDVPMPAKARIKNVEWKPTMTRSDMDLGPLSIYGPITIALLSVDDVREDPRIIGKAYEDQKVRNVFVPIATKINVAKWSKSSFEKVLQVLNLKSDEKKGNLRLEIEITAFSIFDDFTQTGTASLHVNARTSEDLLIWEGQINGTSDLYVHPTNSDGISECLSNTLMVTLYNVLTDQSFSDAVVKAFE